MYEFLEATYIGWDKETPEGWENILAEVERFIKELEDV